MTQSQEWTPSESGLPPTGSTCWIWNGYSIIAAEAEYYTSDPPPDGFVWTYAGDCFLRRRDVSHYIVIPRPDSPPR